jgi:Matrixin
MNLTRIIALLTSVICTVLLIAFSTVITPPPKTYTEQSHITLYVDRDFDQNGQDIIIQAALEWTEATNHLVEYSVVRLPVLGTIDVENSIFITLVSSDFPDIMQLDQGGNITLGLYRGKGQLRYIMLVPSRLDETNYKTVVLHELGHSLGLKHSAPIKFGTLMYPIIDLGSNHITETDLIQFCQIHHCNINDLKH